MNKGFYNGLSDEEFLKKKFKAQLGYELNLENPRTFNEKLQWLKLYDRQLLYTTLVDKFAVKQYVAKIIGEEHVIPTLGVWNTVEEIDIKKLPRQFVLKTTHDSGGIVICKDKSEFDWKSAKKKLSKSLKHDYFAENREWPYKNVPRRIICEQYMEDSNTGDLPDYKVHSFNGTPKVILVCRDRFKNSGMTEDFFSETWEHLDVSRPNHSNSINNVERPTSLEEMIALTKKITADIPFARTDFYSINNKLYFGEVTFYPSSGFTAFCPEEYDYKFGEWIKLPGGGYIVSHNECYLLVDINQNTTANTNGELKDYKFFCFNGDVKFFKVDFNRFQGHRANYYDVNGLLLPFGEAKYPPKPEENIEIPENYKDMIGLAERLSSGVPFLRVDFYNVSNHIYFGELTFFPASGFGKFAPEEWDLTIGKLLVLPNNKRG